MEVCKIKVSLISAKAMPMEPLPSGWKFAFTTGYGRWALSAGNRGGNPVVPMVPWEIVIEVRQGDNSLRHLVTGDENSLTAPSNFCPTLFFETVGGFKFLVWTKRQALFLRGNQGSWCRKYFPWQKPFTYFCALSAILFSGFYNDKQMIFLFNQFDPEWAEKGYMIDDQSFFRDSLGEKRPKVYNGYWKFFVNRLSVFLSRRGLLFLKSPHRFLETEFSVACNVSAPDSEKILSRMPPFFSDGLQVGLFHCPSRMDLTEFHHSLPATLQDWIEIHRDPQRS